MLGRHSQRWSLSVLMMAAPVFAGAAITESTNDTPSPEAAAVRLLLERREGPQALSRSALVRELAALGPSHLPAVLDLLLGQEPEGLALPAPGLTGSASALEPLLLDVIWQWPREGVRSALIERVGPEASPHGRLQILRLLNAGDEEGLLQCAFEVLEGMHPVHYHRRHAGTQIETVLRTATESRASLRILVARREYLDPGLLSCAARVLGKRQRPRDLDALVQLLGLDAGLDQQVLEQLTGLTAGIGDAALDRIAPQVRALTRSPESGLRKRAATTLGRLHDTEGVDWLIELLDDSNRGVARAACEALREIGAVRWPAEAQRWRSWVDAERRWYSERGHRLAQSVHSNMAPAQAVRVCRELGGHPLFRRELVVPLNRALQAQDARVIVACCSALGRLGGLYAAPTLVGLLEAREADVRERSRAALIMVCGQDLGADPRAWWEWLES